MAHATRPQPALRSKAAVLLSSSCAGGRKVRTAGRALMLLRTPLLPSGLAMDDMLTPPPHGEVAPSTLTGDARRVGGNHGYGRFQPGQRWELASLRI